LYEVAMEEENSYVII